MLAIIGGTGLYQLPGLETETTHAARTPFGARVGAGAAAAGWPAGRCSSCRATAPATGCCRTR